MTAKKKKEKKVMEEKRPSLPEVVTVRKRPRTPGVTLNRLSNYKARLIWQEKTSDRGMPLEASSAVGVVAKKATCKCSVQP